MLKIRKVYWNNLKFTKFPARIAYIHVIKILNKINLTTQHFYGFKIICNILKIYAC